MAEHRTVFEKGHKFPGGQILPGKTLVSRFDNVADLVTASKAVPESEWRRDGDARDSWYGGRSFDQACSDMIGPGLPAITEKMRLFVEDVESSGILTHGRPTVTTDLVGFRPCVPKLLSGEPDSMFTVKRTAGLNEGAPLRVFVDMAVSASVPASAMLERGAAIMALVWLLADRRAVELYAYASFGGDYTNREAYIPVVSFGCAPLDPALIGYTLAHAAAMRRVAMNWAWQFGYRGNWAWTEGADTDKHRRSIRLALDVDETDLVIYGAYSKNPEIQNAKAWLNTMVLEHVGLIE